MQEVQYRIVMMNICSEVIALWEQYMYFVVHGSSKTLPKYSPPHCGVPNTHKLLHSLPYTVQWQDVKVGILKGHKFGSQTTSFESNCA